MAKDKNPRSRDPIAEANLNLLSFLTIELALGFGFAQQAFVYRQSSNAKRFKQNKQLAVRVLNTVRHFEERLREKGMAEEIALGRSALEQLILSL